MRRGYTPRGPSERARAACRTRFDSAQLTRAELERPYSARPRLRKAELIEGLVFMPSPVSQAKHSRPHLRLPGWIAAYEAATPGTEAGDNGAVRLDLDNEPQARS